MSTPSPYILTVIFTAGITLVLIITVRLNQPILKRRLFL